MALVPFTEMLQRQVDSGSEISLALDGAVYIRTNGDISQHQHIGTEFVYLRTVNDILIHNCKLLSRIFYLCKYINIWLQA